MIYIERHRHHRTAAQRNAVSSLSLWILQWSDNLICVWREPNETTKKYECIWKHDYRIMSLIQRGRDQRYVGMEYSPRNTTNDARWTSTFVHPANNIKCVINSIEYNAMQYIYKSTFAVSCSIFDVVDENLVASTHTTNNNNNNKNIDEQCEKNNFRH